MHADVAPDPVDRTRFPPDEWRLVERSPSSIDLGLTETLFAVGNGYLGLRGTPEEGRPTVAHGTLINGFHETWPIQHAEAAFGFARTGQTILNAPDATVLKVYVDDEPLIVGTCDLEEYERTLDFRDGILRRRLVWRTPSGKRVMVETSRMVSMTTRHLAVCSVRVTMLEGSAPVAITSALINRQDGTHEYIAPPLAEPDAAEQQDGFRIERDPRRAATLDGRVLQPRLASAAGDRLELGYEARRSGMTVAATADHIAEAPAGAFITHHASEDQVRWTLQCTAAEGSTVTVDKYVAYQTSKGVEVGELASRCHRTLDRALRSGREGIEDDQRAWYADFWERADVVVVPDESSDEELDQDPVALQQAIRFNLFSLAQATARADGQGVAAKGVTGSGYEGHYFWDTEIYVLPFLTFTSPETARNALQFRVHMLPSARDRAAAMATQGALYPWRTINGEEASAYYAAGTAQVHIDADISYAIVKYAHATGDEAFLAGGGVDVLVETSRMWADLGFWRSNGDDTFHIHGVTGPDEYTTVVNNNLFTNVMARYNLEQAVSTLARIEAEDPELFAEISARLSLEPGEIDEWRRCARGMRIPYDEHLGIHPQDDFFLDREVWDLAATPPELHPLLLHYHPLVIYRFQVLKQADVVLALFLQGDRFDAGQKLRDFEYYAPITTGDSTLSAVVESIVAAEVGHHREARAHFHEALYVDLGDLHGNTADGIHIASAGGVWAALVNGFGGMRHYDDGLHFDPRLPASWKSLNYTLTWRDHRIQVDVSPTELAITSLSPEAPPLHLYVRDVPFTVPGGESLAVSLDHQGDRFEGKLSTPRGRRPDGTRMQPQLPPPVPEPLTMEQDTARLPVIFDPDDA